MKKTGSGKKWLLLLAAACAAGFLPAAQPYAMAAESELITMYGEDEYILPDSASRYLTKADLEGLTKAELRLARNEIYARHGRIFGSKDLKDYFSSRSWYEGTIPADSFNESSLNQYETKNVDLILEAEKTAPTEKTGSSGSGAKTGSGTNTGNGTSAGIGKFTGTSGQSGTGSQTVHTGSYTDAEIVNLAKRYYHDYLGQFYLTVELESSDSGTVSLHIYEQMPDHTATTAWLDVDRNTGAAVDSVLGTKVNLLLGAGAPQGQYVLPDSASWKLEASDLAGMSKADLRLARNEIFARRGRKFTNSELKKYFSSCSWYKGTIDPDDFDENVLNWYEKTNLELISAVESGEIIPSSNAGSSKTAGQGTSQTSQAGQTIPAFSGSEAQAMTDVFAYWLVGSVTEFSSLNNALRISMSYDILEPEYERTGRMDRKKAEALMQDVFGSSFQPSDSDYAQAGWKVNAAEIDFQVGDWGEDEPECTLQSFDSLGNNRYEAEILYQQVDWPDVKDWCTVRWQFAWDGNLQTYVITDAAKELVGSFGFDEEDDMLVDDFDDDMDDDMDDMDDDMDEDDFDDDMDEEMDEDEEEMMIQVFVDDGQ